MPLARFVIEWRGKCGASDPFMLLSDLGLSPLRVRQSSSRSGMTLQMEQDVRNDAHAKQIIGQLQASVDIKSAFRASSGALIGEVAL